MGRDDRSRLQRFRAWLAGVLFEVAGRLDPVYDVWLDEAPPRHPASSIDLETGFRIHRAVDCHPPCPFHAPSPHHMTGWRKVIRESNLVERMCPHGVGHPDPDSIAYMDDHGGEDNRGSWGVHGCDGCCRAPEPA